MKDNPSILQSPIVVENYRMAELSKSDVKEYMDIFNDAYIEQKFDMLHTYVYEFSFQCQFAVTTMYVPASKLNGEELIDIYSKEKNRLPSVFMTVIPSEKKSYFIMSCIDEDYRIIKDYFDEVENLNDVELKRFLNWTLPTYSENIVLSPRLWNAWKTPAKIEYEHIIAGMFGDFEKILQHEDPFENVENYFSALQTQYGIINIKKDTKYDLFLLRE